MGGYPCCCDNDPCFGNSFAESFNAALSSKWTVNALSGTTVSITGGRLRITRSSGTAGASVTTCIQEPVFDDPVVLTLETQVYYNNPFGGLTLTGRWYQGLAIDLGDCNFAWYWNMNGGTANVTFEHEVGGGVQTDDYGITLTDGDVLKMVVTSLMAGEVDKVECYFNGVLTHTETFAPDEVMNLIAAPTTWVFVQGFTGGFNTPHEFEYFNLTIT